MISLFGPLALFTVALAAWADAGTSTAIAELRREFNNAAVILQSMPADTRSTTEQGLYLRQQGQVLRTYRDWMLAEANAAQSALMDLDKLERELKTGGVTAVAASAHVQRVNLALRSADDRVQMSEAGRKLRKAFAELDASAQETKHELAVLADQQRAREQHIAALAPTIKATIWRIWFYNQQAQTADILSAVFDSRASRYELRHSRESALSALETLFRELPAPATRLITNMPEWPISGGAFDPRKPEDQKELRKAVKKILERAGR